MYHFRGLRLFSQRLIRPELLDHAGPEEARLNLEDLVRINRNFGGHSVLRKTLARVARKEDAFTLLDIGAGSGDAARIIQDLYPLATVTSLDCKEVHIENAGYPKLVGDAFQMPFRPGSFDYVFCSLFLHHFRDDQVTGLLRSFYATARRALLVERFGTPRSSVLVSAGDQTAVPLAKNHVTRWSSIGPGIVSARRASRVGEQGGCQERSSGSASPRFQNFTHRREGGKYWAVTKRIEGVRWALGGRYPPAGARQQLQEVRQLAWSPVNRHLPDRAIP